MAVIAAFIPYYWLPIRARSPAPSPDTTAAVTRDAAGTQGASRLLTLASSRNLRAVERTSPNSTARAVRLRRTVEASPVREVQA
jgi:hypothetical protein